MLSQKKRQLMNHSPRTETNMQKLSVKEKSGYAIGEIASNIIWASIMFFLANFYTDVFGLPAAVAGTMFLIVKLFDAFNDPIMGMIADRTNTRWGKFRPYILFASVPYAVFGVLMFITPDFSLTGKIIYAYATYTSMMVIYTVMMIPYAALGGVMTSDPIERTSLQSYRFVGAFAGNLLIQGLTLKLVAYFGGGNDAKGYQMTMAIFAVMCVAFFYVTFATTKERVQPDPMVKPSIKHDLKDLIGNRPWVIVALVLFVMLIYIGIRSAVIVYYFTYYVGDKALTAWYLTGGTVIIIISMLLPKWLTLTFGKRNSLVGLLIIIALAIGANWFARPQDKVLMFVLQFIQAAASGPTMPLLWAMMADAADYSEWLTGRRATALFYSASTLALKSGGALGGALALWILAAFHYQPNVAQAPETLHGMRLMMSVYPALGALICAGLVAFYNLPDKKLLEIEKELNRRRVNR